ncbi:pH-dependent sodium/proton antiporter [Corynebacterium kutscheri]|nr:pH-dependent sodium/proton antiporter [Corynebacterium kutscheri]
MVALSLVGLGLAATWLLTRMHVWRVFPYLLLAVFTWAAMYFAGVHATLAGVLLALIMPVTMPHEYYVGNVKRLLDLY